MLHTSTQSLIQKLCELTQAGAIDWREGERQCSKFDTEGYTVEVEAEPPTVRVIDGNGRELERASTNDLRATSWHEGGTYADQVADMAERAHRVARGAERAISRILSSLSAPPQTVVAATEREPEACAPDFEADDEQAQRPAISAAESDAAIAAVEADMYRPPETDEQTNTALAPAEPVQAAPSPAPQSIVAPPTAAPVAPARVVNILGSDGVVRQPASANGAEPRAFGSITAFGRSIPRSEALTSANAPSGAARWGGLLLTGIHAVTRQTMREPTRPAPEKTATNVYKPWS